MIITPISGDDVIEWPDGTWCYRRELSEMSHKSDDFIILPVNSHDWQQFFRNLDHDLCLPTFPS